MNRLIRIYEAKELRGCSLCKRAILAGENCTLGNGKAVVCRDCVPFIQTSWTTD